MHADATGCMRGYVIDAATLFERNICRPRYISDLAFMICSLVNAVLHYLSGGPHPPSNHVTRLAQLRVLELKVLSCCIM